MQSDPPPIEILGPATAPLAMVVRRSFESQATRFVTGPESNLQVGFIVTKAGGDIQRHRHLPITRQVNGTMEVIIVRSGSCQVDLYLDDGTPVCSQPLHAGDLVILYRGAHGFRVDADTVLLEVKQGPYAGADDKERF
jgi:quercetin dioxygenase-like cupin family protein